MTAPHGPGASPLRNTVNLHHDNREGPDMASPPRRYGTEPTSVTARAEMGSATSRNPPGRLKLAAELRDVSLQAYAVEPLGENELAALME
jgi:hypothetical protein